MMPPIPHPGLRGETGHRAPGSGLRKGRARIFTVPGARCPVPASLLTAACAAMAIAFPALATEVEVTAKAAVTDVSVGQRFVVAVTASGPAGTKWTYPGQPGDDKVELRPAPTPAPGPDAFNYEAAAFAVGDVAVPAITVKYRLPDGTQGEATSEPIPLHIVSLLPRQEAERKLADIRPPVKLPLGAFFWGGLAALALLLAATVLALRRLRRRPAAAMAAAAPELAPDVEALAALDTLTASPALLAADLKPFYVALAEIAKRYLGRRLGAPILEMTSAEAVAHLRDSVPARDLASPLRELMGAADQVKFARGHGERGIAERHLQAVRAMVTALEARLRPAEQPPLEKSA
jgi:hypothetical protein